MKKTVKRLLQQVGVEVTQYNKKEKIYRRLFQKYKDFTMIEQQRFLINLELCERFKHLEGDYAECGVWRGGMSAAIAEVIGNEKRFHLFDSFEGLPPAQEIDGEAAIKWQQDKTSPTYFENCRAEKQFAINAMTRAGHTNYETYQGWFSDTLPLFKKRNLSILRLDGDWYESVMTSLKYLYPMVVQNGLVILDDYPYWTGCSRAVHKYLSDISSESRIHEVNNVTYILKREKQS